MRYLERGEHHSHVFCFHCLQESLQCQATTDDYFQGLFVDECLILLTLLINEYTGTPGKPGTPLTT